MNTCSCHQLDGFLEPHPDEEFPKFIDSFAKLNSYEDVWLGQCQICQQSWVVNSVSRGPLMVKTGIDISLEAFDEMHYRKLSYLQHNGGESREQCMYRGCSKNAVKNMAICVDHALD